MGEGRSKGKEIRGVEVGRGKEKRRGQGRE